MPTSQYSLLLVFTVLALLKGVISHEPPSGDSNTRGMAQRGHRKTCPAYGDYAKVPHGPVSGGKLGLPFQRPPVNCRTFHSPAVEAKLLDIRAKILDLDVARLWENTFPNTLDTTIKFHQTKPEPLTFVVTGDIDAEWLRDSQRQLAPYITVLSQLTPEERAVEPLTPLLLGAIAQQARFVGRAPHCNAFQAPPESRILATAQNAQDMVTPHASPYFTHECKYELDSLASFLALSNDYYAATEDHRFVTEEWRTAVSRVLLLVSKMTIGSHNYSTGEPMPIPYSFRRYSDAASETNWNQGAGMPVRDTGMVRSWFRPSDDACVFQFNVPANAMLSVELKKLASYYDVEFANPYTGKMQSVRALSDQIRNAIWNHAVKDNPRFGQVFAYEVDGYGSTLFMDDANLPNLLSLSDMGFVSATDNTYVRTRRLSLHFKGNPYYVKSATFEGVGGPHVGLRHAWPMSRIVAIRSTNDIREIRDHLKVIVQSTRGLGLIHESVNVDTNEYTRAWFAWANSEFAKTILDLDERELLEEATRDLLRTVRAQE